MKGCRRSAYLPAVPCSRSQCLPPCSQCLPPCLIYRLLFCSADQSSCRLTAVGFEPTQLALVELESTPLDHSGKLSMCPQSNCAVKPTNSGPSRLCSKFCGSASKPSALAWSSGLVGAALLDWECLSWMLGLSLDLLSAGPLSQAHLLQVSKSYSHTASQDIWLQSCSFGVRSKCVDRTSSTTIFHFRIH